MGMHGAAWGFRVALFSALGFAPLGGCASSSSEEGDGPEPEPLPRRDCTDVPIVALDGSETGLASCGPYGPVHRPQQRACSSAPGAVSPECLSSQSSCHNHSDCTAGPNGRCGLPFVQPPAPASACACTYGCTTDDECATGQICRCDPDRGRCISAACSVDSDCADGQRCVEYEDVSGCGDSSRKFACTTPADECHGSAECPGAAVCMFELGAYRCRTRTCYPGRPFLVEGTPRVADVVRRGDWSSALEPLTSELRAESRRALAGHWVEVALMEQASIAAFARFTLELLSLGAPAELVVEARSAMMDETAHARDAFALASAYGGAPVGPGAFADAAMSGARSAEDIVMTAILEGCIGETVASLEASQALDGATDPAVRAALERVVPDEARHSILAWRFVRWILAEGTLELRRVAARGLEAAVAAAMRESSTGEAVDAAAHPAVLAAHGMQSVAARLDARRRALTDVIAPCAERLIQEARRLHDSVILRNGMVTTKTAPSGLLSST